MNKETERQGIYSTTLLNNMKLYDLYLLYTLENKIIDIQRDNIDLKKIREMEKLGYVEDITNHTLLYSERYAKFSTTPQGEEFLADIEKFIQSYSDWSDEIPIEDGDYLVRFHYRIIDEERITQALVWEIDIDTLEQNDPEEFDKQYRQDHSTITNGRWITHYKGKKGEYRTFQIFQGKWLCKLYGHDWGDEFIPVVDDEIDFSEFVKVRPKYKPLRTEWKPFHRQ